MAMVKRFSLHKMFLSIALAFLTTPALLVTPYFTTPVIAAASESPIEMPSIETSRCTPSNSVTIDGKKVYKNGILRGVPCAEPLSTLDQALKVVENVIFIFLLPLVGTLFIIMLLTGGILYISSRGNPQQLERAKKTLTWAIVGLIVVTLSYTIVLIFAKVIGGGIT